MEFNISNTQDGYVVYAHLRYSIYEERWMPLRNFGDRQSDAIEFRYWDCPMLDDMQLKALAKNYDPERKYKRINSRQFKLQL